MTGLIREKTSELNAQIIEAFFEEGMSIAALMAKYGRSESTINKMLAAYQRAHAAENDGRKRERTKKPTDPRPLVEKRSISFIHFSISLHISRYMNEHELKPTTFGLLIGKSRVQVSAMQIGAYDFTITDLQRLSEVLGIPYEQLCVPPVKPINTNPERTRAHAGA